MFVCVFELVGSYLSAENTVNVFKLRSFEQGRYQVVCPVILRAHSAGAVEYTGCILAEG